MEYHLTVSPINHIKISVIIPSYKPGDYVFQCLESIIQQTLCSEDFEVIIVLNGCNEPWSNRIINYIKLNMYNNNVHFCQVDSPGVSNARNLGLNMSNGEYITFIDDDDYISSNYLYELYQNSSKNCVAVSNTLAVSMSSSSSKYHLTYKYEKQRIEQFSNIYKARSYFSGPCMKLIHKDIISNKLFNTLLSNGEDTLFMFEISDRIQCVSYTSPSAIYYRRVRENSATTRHRTNREMIKSDLIQLKRIIICYIKHPFRYNFYFFINRVLGCLYFIFRSI